MYDQKVAGWRRRIVASQASTRKRLGDIAPAAVRQRHREPATWQWQRDGEPIVFESAEPPNPRSGPIALRLAVSATVTDERITAVLGPDTAIWSLTAASPGLDVLRRPEDQVAYRQRLRELFDRIKAVRGEDAVINVFPVLPVSLAVETGRVWMAKADLPLKIYDQNRRLWAFRRHGHRPERQETTLGSVALKWP